MIIGDLIAAQPLRSPLVGNVLGGFVVNRHTPLIAALALVIVAVLAVPSVTSAQGRRGARVRVVPRTSVVVGVGVGAGYYRPYYGYYDPFYGPWFYPYAAYQYPPYYGYGRYDLSSSLRLQVTPRNTEVFIDGYYAGTVDDFDGFFQRLHIEPGEHDLQLFLPGHRTVAQKIYLQPGNTFRVKHTMEPLAAGEQEAQRPVATPPPPQPQPQTRQAPGPVTRQPRDPRPLPPAGRNTVQPESGYGTLSLRVQPGETNVRIDGERWEGPQGDDRLIVQLSAGRHVLNIQRDGYREYMTEVTVRSGETATLNVALTKQ